MSGNHYQDQDGEQFWIENIRNGDERAFEILFKKYYEQLTRLTHGYVRSRAIAEELVQEVFTEIWISRETWYITESLRSYLYRAARNRSLNYLKHQEVKRRYDPEWMEHHHQPGLPDVDEPVSDEVLREAIRSALEELPERSKTTYKLHRHDGLTYKEIAAVMGVSVKTVESHMSKTLKLLRSRLSKFLPVLLSALLRL
ncbi:MAG: RNA polymerase sigma-70 factor [Balneolaceae bacterium]